jgi:hypothetical protein
MSWRRGARESGRVATEQQRFVRELRGLEHWGSKTFTLGNADGETRFGAVWVC